MKRKIDPVTTIIPLTLILLLCICFIADPSGSANVLESIRNFLEDTMGLYYLVVGVGVFLVSFYIAFSDRGRITLGKSEEKPKYSFFTWGSMMFTAGLAADILFYSFCEWLLYAGEPRIEELGTVQDWASVIPLFHWGPIPWSFYAVLAACFGFMLHSRGVQKQKYSEACRPILGRYTDGIGGKIIDITAVIALIAGTATTFSLATPLLSSVITFLFGIPDSKILTISILAVICLIYTLSVLRGMKGVRILAKLCMYVFFALLMYVFILGGSPVYILETGFSAIGNLLQNFIGLSTWTDALRLDGFPQKWTVFYWAYWMVWCVAAPFFMGSISGGRTIKQVILGAYVFGMGSTFMSFIVLGNYGLGLQMRGELDAMGLYASTGDLYRTIMAIVESLPASWAVMVLLIVSMIAFYATSFDSITLVASTYSYRQIGEDEEVGNGMKLFWAVLLILFPIALLFSDSSMKNLQTVSMIAAFPVGLVIMIMIASFFKDTRNYIKK
ncbi:BCCT family transporter [Lachnospiraceae bacterium 56-18]|jgi:BCCT family betaine/carnitine transporter